jgi:hypothetical protein
VRWAKFSNAMLIAALAVIAFGSALLSALVAFPNGTHRQLLATIEQLFPR